MNKIVVVGAGIAGLSFAYEALKNGYNVTVVEKADEVGGLCRSITVNDCQLDIGVHILHGRDPQVLSRVKEIVEPDEWVEVERNGKLFLKGKYINWPLNAASIFQIPFSLGLNIFFDQLKKRRIEKVEKSNFQNELINIYGPNLYYSFFHPLTKRFLNTDPQNIHADWAFSSIRSATKLEDASFKKSHKYLPEDTTQNSKSEFNVFKFLYNSLFNKQVEAFFYFKDGYGVLPNSYRDKIIELGGTILTQSAVDSFVLENNKIRQCIINGENHDCDKVMWTGDIRSLCTLLDIDDPKLTYIHSKFLYVFLKDCLKKHQVCYYADDDISFVRGTILSNHSKSIIQNPDVADIICLEYTFSSKDELLNNPEQFQAEAAKNLIKVDIIKTESSIESIYELNVPFTYPVLTIDYKDKLRQVRSDLSNIENLLTLGRQGSFGYENADIIIKEAINHPLFVS